MHRSILNIVAGALVASIAIVASASPATAADTLGPDRTPAFAVDSYVIDSHQFELIRELQNFDVACAAISTAQPWQQLLPASPRTVIFDQPARSMLAPVRLQPRRAGALGGAIHGAAVA